MAAEKTPFQTALDFVLGEESRRLEEEAASYSGVKYAAGVNSGTDALILALRALGIGAGEKMLQRPDHPDIFLQDMG